MAKKRVEKEGMIFVMNLSRPEISTRGGHKGGSRGRLPFLLSLGLCEFTFFLEFSSSFLSVVLFLEFCIFSLSCVSFFLDLILFL